VNNNTDNKINVRMASKALYSSWCLHQTYNTLFDCGEGCATSLTNALPGIDQLFFSHGHGDHTLGLPSFIGCRNAAQGTSRNADTMKDHNKPLTIYYPEDNDLFDDLFKFCGRRYDHWLRYELKTIEIGPGFELQLGKNVYVRAIEMLHQKNAPTLGYVIYENRTRLKPEFVGKDIPALLRNGLDRTTINETYRANLFAYCLDAYAIVNPTEIENCNNVIMDCTFLNVVDRTDMTHFTLDESLELCKAMGVKHMFAAHLSPRYNFNDYIGSDYVTVINPHKVNHL
jgi:ribonuclease Z